MHGSKKFHFVESGRRKRYFDHDIGVNNEPTSISDPMNNSCLILIQYSSIRDE